MDFKEKFGGSPIKNKLVAIPVALLLTAIMFYGPIVSLVEAQKVDPKAIYKAKEGKFVVSYWKDNTWPWPDGWKKEVVKSATPMIGSNKETLIRTVDMVGAKEDLPCENVVVEDLDKPRLISSPVYYLRLSKSSGTIIWWQKSELSIPVKWSKPIDKEGKATFSDGYGNRGSWFCPEGVEKIPAK